MGNQAWHNYTLSSEKAVNWLSAQLNSDGSYRAELKDLALYYKSPYLFSISGKAEEARLILSYIKNTFMRENGDFTSQAGAKTENSALAEYWAYMNGWIAIAAQKMGDFDVAYPAYHYLLSFSHPALGGFTTNKPYGEGDSAVDVLTAAHLGLMALYFGNLEQAKASGNLLDRFIEAQPALDSAFYLRMKDRGELVTDFPQEAALLFAVSPTQPNQAYFMIGYPVAFLGQLYRATGDRGYLNSAIKYLDFALSCHESIRSFHFSHKVAWGAAVIANLTGDRRSADFSKSIADYLVSIQDGEGFWLKDEPEHTLFDQTAEIAIWLKEISRELGTV